MISLAIVIFFSSIGYLLFLDNKDDVNNITSDTGQIEKDSEREESLSSEVTMPPVKENKYYVIYIKQENGTASSFVPETLNPGFRNDSDYNVSISIDDNGNIINDEKIIEIDNFIISNQNKEEIKKIAGVENYDEALKEIEERVLEAKKSVEESS